METRTRSSNPYNPAPTETEESNTILHHAKTFAQTTGRHIASLAKPDVPAHKISLSASTLLTVMATIDKFQDCSTVNRYFMYLAIIGFGVLAVNQYGVGNILKDVTSFFKPKADLGQEIPLPPEALKAMEAEKNASPKKTL
jgi:hypothetical protein